MQTLDQLIAEAARSSRGSSRAHLELIAGCARNEHFDAGDATLVREGDPADRFYLIREGRVALEVHAPGAGRS